ncbi:MAG: NAD(P)/FAD-dependent oxidoreductase [Firmicutes bacterium]|nr:NAD(P)/FAD-dependent oxidoreductase [Bacillota bacterium]
MRYLIIGNSAAGLFGLKAIRETDPAGEIVLLSDERGPAYSRCMTTHYIAGRVSEKQMYLEAEEFYRHFDIDARFDTAVTKVDPVQRKITCLSGDDISFDRLLIATGASPVIPDIPGIHAEGVYTLRTLEDARSIKQRALTGANVVVLGGGPVGLKTAYALLQRGMQVSVVAKSPQILSQSMDAAGANLIQIHLEEKGMRFYLEQNVNEILTGSQGAVRAVKLDDHNELPCSMVIAGKGVRPNTKFLGADFKINKGIVTNNYLETNQTGIYAAGDVTETFDMALGNIRVNATWPNAAAQGRLAGRNMAGYRDCYAGSLSLNSLEFFGLCAATAGISNAKGPEYEVLESKDIPGRRYRRLVFRDQCLVGYVAVNDVDGVGALTARIKAKAPVKDKKALLARRLPIMGDWACSAV